jgi:exoribonuclease II
MTSYHDKIRDKLLEKNDGTEPVWFELVEKDAEPRRSWDEVADEIRRIRQEREDLTDDDVGR